MTANPAALGDGQPSFVKYLFENGIISGPIFCIALRNIAYDPIDSSFIDFGFINNQAMINFEDLTFIPVVSDANLHYNYFWVNKITGIRFRN